MKNWLSSHSRFLQRWTLKILERLWHIVLFTIFASLAGVNAFLLWRIASRESPDGTTVASLAVITIVSLLLAFWGRDLVRRVRKIGSAGVEFHVWEDIEQIPELRDAPTPPNAALGGDATISPQQAWPYELLSNLWYHLGVDATELSGLDLQRYRDMVLWLGKTALTQRGTHLRKALEVLRSIEDLADLGMDESYFLAMAYYRVAIHQEDRDAEGSRAKFQRSVDLLKRVVKEDAADASSHYVLGYAYDELGRYDLAIKHDRKAVELDEGEYGTVGRWNEAVSLLKQEEPVEALAVLRQIPESASWDKIWEDDELAPLRHDPQLGDPFRELWIRKSGRQTIPLLG